MYKNSISVYEYIRKYIAYLYTILYEEAIKKETKKF